MGSLAKELDAFQDALLERTCRRNADILRKMIARSRQADGRNAEITVGDIAPTFTLPDQFGQATSLANMTDAGPVVLTFVRGGWCPFCEISLRAYNGIVPALRRGGAQLVAISPEAPAGCEAMAEANGLGFRILSDRGAAVARGYGLVRALDPEARELYERLGHDIPRLNGIGTWELPTTATYVVGRDGVVVRAHVDHRVAKRMEPSEMLDAVRSLHTAEVGHAAHVA